MIVYTRCAGLSRRRAATSGVYNDGTRRERKVRRAPPARAARSIAPSIWIGTVAFARSGPGGCPGLYVKRRGHLRRLDTPGSRRDRPARVAGRLPLHAGGRPEPDLRARALATGSSSRRVVTRLRAPSARATRVTSPVFDGRYVYWLQEDQVRHEFFAGRGRAGRPRRSSSPQQTLPGRVDSIALGDGRALLHNGRGVFQATDPCGFAAARLESPRRMAPPRRALGQDLSAVRVRGGPREDPRVRACGRRGEPRSPRPRGGARPGFATSWLRRCSASSTRPARWARRSSTRSSGST